MFNIVKRIMKLESLGFTILDDLESFRFFRP